MLNLRQLFDFSFQKPHTPSVNCTLWTEYRHVVEPLGLFDPEWYLQRYPEVRDAGQHPFDHYIVQGWQQGYSPCPAFDAQWYLAAHTDVARSGNEPLFHYIQFGKAEGRQIKAVDTPSPAEVAAAKAVELPAVTEPAELYRAPLRLGEPRRPKRVVAVGSCLLQGLVDEIGRSDPDCLADFYLMNNQSQLPTFPTDVDPAYDFQIVQLAMRSIVPDLAFAKLSHADQAGHLELFEECKQRLTQRLRDLLRWNIERGLLTFVIGFLVPQQNPAGRLLPRSDLRNYVFFVEELNRALIDALNAYSNVYYLDFDAIVASFGKQYFLDDAVWWLSHNSNLSDFDILLDGERLDGRFLATERYPSQAELILKATWSEMLAMWRVTIADQMVKLVIIDLDDTLWRGIPAEEEVEFDDIRVEGWPMGFAESLMFLKRRGVLLAIASKNDEARVIRNWPHIVGPNSLQLSDFAVTRINWTTKSENIRQILEATNLLPQNVVFIDDNPVERASVKAAFPAIRVLGANYLEWRRILLWSAETQVPAITTESANRTDSIQANVRKVEIQAAMSRAEFLQTSEIRLQVIAIDDADHPRFTRCLELINKTNQFNTTGLRRTQQDLSQALEGDTTLFAMTVIDKFVDYGLVGVAVVNRNDIAQIVMSCRVFGMEVELGFASLIKAELARRGYEAATGNVIETERNQPARDIFLRSGFHETETGWIADLSLPSPIPPHIRIV